VSTIQAEAMSKILMEFISTWLDFDICN